VFSRKQRLLAISKTDVGMICMHDMNKRRLFIAFWSTLCCPRQLSNIRAM
jgi:hypothetical protein